MLKNLAKKIMNVKINEVKLLQNLIKNFCMKNLLKLAIFRAYLISLKLEASIHFQNTVLTELWEPSDLEV